jgi:hypothetical protein
VASKKPVFPAPSPAVGPASAHAHPNKSGKKVVESSAPRGAHASAPAASLAAAAAGVHKKGRGALGKKDAPATARAAPAPPAATPAVLAPAAPATALARAPAAPTTARGNDKCYVCGKVFVKGIRAHYKAHIAGTLPRRRGWRSRRWRSTGSGCGARNSNRLLVRLYRVIVHVGLEHRFVKAEPAGLEAGLHRTDLDQRRCLEELIS